MRWLLFFLLISCGGTRKTTNDKTEISEQKNDSIVVEVIKEKQSQISAFEATPIVYSDPMTINGIVYRNATIRKIDTEIKEVEKEVVKWRTITKTTTLYKTKTSNRTDYTLIILVVGLILLLYLVLKRHQIL